MSVVLNLIVELYSMCENFIKEEIETHFFIGLLFVLLWMIIFGIIGFIIWLTVYDWRITAFIGVIILIIEFLCYLGYKLKD